MPGSNDPHIRNKLQNFTAPSDPADWAAMEALLDQKSKRGFFWLWFIAIPLVLLGPGSLYFFFPVQNEGINEMVSLENKFYENLSEAQIKEFTVYPAENENSDEAETSEAERKKVLLGNEKNDAPVAAEEKKETFSNEGIPKVESGLKTTGKEEKELGKNRDAKTYEEFGRKDSPVWRESTGSFLPQKTSNENPVSGNDEGNRNAPMAEFNYSSSNKTTTEEKQTGNVYEVMEETQKVLEKESGELLPEEKIVSTWPEGLEFPDSMKLADTIEPEKEATEQSPEDDDPEKYPKPKKKVRIQMGLSITVSESFTNPVKFIKPGFEAGYRFELIIKNKFGIATGIGYSKQNYHIKEAICNPFGYYRCPESYTSTVKSMNIPLLVRYNFLKKEKLNVYARAGIVNHIKLEETFDYNFTVIDTPQPPNPPPLPPPATMTSYQSSLLQEDNLQGTSFNYLFGDALNDFSISGNKRYHLSYLLGAGIEYRYKKLALQAEVNYSLLSRKIGIQKTRLNSLGLKGSVVLQIGR